MLQESTSYRVLLFLGIAGFLISVLAGLAEHVELLQSFCSSFSDGCRDAAKLTLLRLPLWIWGAAFYALLVLFILLARQWLIWLVAGAVGIEFNLVWIMVSMEIVCVFCLGNLIVVFLLIVFSLERDRFWQMLSVSLLLFLFSMLVVSHENEPLASTTANQGQSDIVAEVAGETVSRAELEMPLASSIYNLEQEIYRLKKQTLDQMISEKLLKREADQQGITIQQLIDGSILAGGVDVEDGEVRKYYQENIHRFSDWKGTQDELIVRIRAHLQQQKGYQKVLDYTSSLNTKYGVVVYLKEPDPPLARVEIEKSPALGPADAPVTVVEFSDYLCPACRKGHEDIKRVRAAYAGQVRWVFKDYPLKKHNDAGIAAEAARCAGEQNRFWDYQDALYGSKDKDLPVERLKEYAGGLGLAIEPFKQCLESRKYKGDIDRELEEARKIGVDSTPTFVINGRLATGAIPFERFKELIDQELAKVARKP